MAYRAAADAILVAHLAFVLFVVFGALLALRWPRFTWLHIPAVVWAAFIEFSGTICPLTPLEVALRQRAGQSRYGGGVIAHYIASLLYPEGLPPNTQAHLVSPAA